MSYPDDTSVEIDVKTLKKVDTPENNKEYYIVTKDLETKTLAKPKKLTFLSLKHVVLGNESEDTYTFNNVITYTNTINYTNKENDTGTRVEFYEIPPAGGKRRNNRRKSAKKGGRSRRMRRYNRKSSLRF